MLFSSDLAISIYLGIVTVILLISIYLYETDKNYLTNKRLQIMLAIIFIIFISIAIIDISTNVEKDIELNDEIIESSEYYSVGQVQLTSSILPIEYIVSEQYELCIVNYDMEFENSERYLDEDGNIVLHISVSNQNNLLIMDRTDDMLIQNLRYFEERDESLNIDGISLIEKNTCESESSETKAILYQN